MSDGARVHGLGSLFSSTGISMALWRRAAYLGIFDPLKPSHFHLFSVRSCTALLGSRPYHYRYTHSISNDKPSYNHFTIIFTLSDAIKLVKRFILVTLLEAIAMFCLVKTSKCFLELDIFQVY